MSVASRTHDAVFPGGFGKPASGRNYAKTAALMSLLLVLLVIGGRAWGGVSGMIVFGALGLAFNFGSYWFSDKIALMVHRAQPLPREQEPEVHRIVEGLTRRAGMPMPAMFVIPTQSPNAFATGRNPEHAAVAVTEGILSILTPRELEGVLAHELSHVRNRDVLIATIAAAVAGLISTLGYIARGGALFGSGGRGQDDRRGGGLELLAWALLAPLIALVIQLAVSRTREYAADASGALLAGDPEPLASALEKLEMGASAQPYPFAGPSTAHLFIVNPLHGPVAGLMNLFSTHPPIEKRIARLRAMRQARPLEQ